MHPAGAEEIVQEPRWANLVGAARMGKDPTTSVVDGFGRTHDVTNLFICDGSILPTQGSANPGVNIQSLAARTADYLISQGSKVFNSDTRDTTLPPVRRELSPRGTHGSGLPRLHYGDIWPIWRIFPAFLASRNASMAPPLAKMRSGSSNRKIS
jgi:hypothetical protein